MIARDRLPKPPSLRRAVLRLLGDVTWPALRRHPARTLLTLVGVVIGVQLFVTIHLVNRATLESVARTIDAVSADADIQLTNGDVGIAENLVERMATVPGVANASGLVRGTFRTPWGVLTVFGVDLFGDQRVRERSFPRRHVHIADELRFANATDSIALSHSFAAGAGLAEGAAFTAMTPTGQTRLVVRGFLDPVGPATLFGGAVALVDLPTAQRLFAREGLLDEIAVAFADGADRAAVTARLSAVVGGGGSLADPRQRVGGLADMLSSFTIILGITSVLGLTVGALLVHHAMRSAVRQRRRSYAIARALGYRRSAVAGAMLVEAAIFGALGGLVAAGLALVAARLAIGAVTGAVAVVWARGDDGVVTLGAGDVGLALVVGIVAAVVAAAGPAFAAARIEVVEQLRSTTERRRTELGRTTVVFGLLACGAACAAFWSTSWWSSSTGRLVAVCLGAMTMTLGYSMLAPGVLRLLVVPIRRFARRSLPLSLAAEHLGRDPVRARGTLGALMAAFAFVLCVTAFVTSLNGTILTWVDQALASDLFVSATPDVPLPSAPTLPAELARELRSLPEVAAVTPTRILLAPVRGQMVGLKAEPVEQFRMRPFPIVAQMEGDYLEAYARGESVLVSDNLAFRMGLRAGDELELDSPTGRQRVRVGAIVMEYSLELGTITMDSEVYRRRWKDEQVTTFKLHVVPGADLARIRTAITERLSDRFAVYVLTASEFKGSIVAAIHGAFLLTYAIQLVAAVIAGIGVVNFFLVEVVDRRREIGLLRTVALDRRQLLETLTAEGMLIGACGGVLAIAWGWPIARIIVTHTARMVAGWHLDFLFPWSVAAVMPIVVGVTAGLAALLPARATTRTSLPRLVGIE